MSRPDTHRVDGCLGVPIWGHLTEGIMERWIKLIADLQVAGYDFDEARAVGTIVNSFMEGEARETTYARLGFIAFEAAKVFQR